MKKLEVNKHTTLITNLVNRLFGNSQQPGEGGMGRMAKLNSLWHKYHDIDEKWKESNENLLKKMQRDEQQQQQSNGLLSPSPNTRPPVYGAGDTIAYIAFRSSGAYEIIKHVMDSIKIKDNLGLTPQPPATPVIVRPPAQSSSTVSTRRKTRTLSKEKEETMVMNNSNNALMEDKGKGEAPFNINRVSGISILDFGSGPGTAVWAARDAVGENNVREVVMIEQSISMWQAAQYLTIEHTEALGKLFRNHRGKKDDSKETEINYDMLSLESSTAKMGLNWCRSFHEIFGGKKEMEDALFAISRKEQLEEMKRKQKAISKGDNDEELDIFETRSRRKNKSDSLKLSDKDMEVIASFPQYDLVTATYSLSEVVSDQARSLVISALWEMTAVDGVFLVVEEGDALGGHVIQSVRDAIREKSNAIILGPCFHAKECPIKAGMKLSKEAKANKGSLLKKSDGGIEIIDMMDFLNEEDEIDNDIDGKRGDTSSSKSAPGNKLRGEENDIEDDAVSRKVTITPNLAMCHFKKGINRLLAPTNSRGQGLGNPEEARKYSYIAFQKISDFAGRKKAKENEIRDNKMKGRLIRSPLKKQKHIILDICVENGKLERHTISKRGDRQDDEIEKNGNMQNESSATNKKKSFYRTCRESEWGDEIVMKRSKYD